MKHQTVYWNMSICFNLQLYLLMLSLGQGHMDPERILGERKNLKLHGQTMFLTKNVMSSTSALSISESYTACIMDIKWTEWMKIVYVCSFCIMNALPWHCCVVSRPQWICLHHCLIIQITDDVLMAAQIHYRHVSLCLIVAVV